MIEKAKEIFDTIDNLFETSPKLAEEYMITALEKSKQDGEEEISLKLYNELIGYYRQTSEKEKLCDAINGVIKLLDDMDASGSISYATTMLNIANAYRAIGRLELAKEYYAKAQEIYDREIKEKRLDSYDLSVAGLYNNMSLLYQELSDYKTAEELLRKALAIVTKNQDKFEIAVTYANLANTMLLSKDFDASYKYAKEAITRFKARNYIDPHYCAALSAMAYCYYEWGEVQRALSLFEKAALIVEQTIGKNSQYERLVENIDMCKNNPQYVRYISGMDISKKFYQEYLRKIIENDFSEYASKITVGLIGEGSECYGFDDEYSTDHDFFPDLCIFVDDDAYEMIGEKITAAYNTLPKEYMGYKSQKTALADGRRGVIKTSDFYSKHLGTSLYEQIDFTKLKDYELAVCTNGEIFYGNNTEFMKMREKLSEGYPAKVRLLKLSEDVAVFSQAGQYNFLRMLKREDDFTAGLMLADFCKGTMILYHHMSSIYPPHDKWLKKSTLRIDGGEELINLLEKVTNMFKISESADDITLAIDDVGKALASKLYENGDISDVDPYLANHISELMFKASVVDLGKEELVDRIVKLEFEAFDKVSNEGGRASCQNNWPTFSIMRKSQYLVWNKDMLIQYLYDFTREYEKGHNLITEKYGRMMESTAPEKYEELKPYFPVISEQKKAIIEQIVALQVAMVEEFGENYPNLAGNARDFHTYEDNYYNTSSETYLRGEISTYSDKMLQLYAGFVVDCVKRQINITKETISNTAVLYGYKDIEEFENR